MVKGLTSALTEVVTYGMLFMCRFSGRKFVPIVRTESAIHFSRIDNQRQLNCGCEAPDAFCCFCIPCFVAFLSLSMKHTHLAIVRPGGPLKIGNRGLAPRILLFSDGHPTESEGDESRAGSSVEHMKQMCLLLGPNYASFGLPFPVPVSCIACGDSPNIPFLQFVAKATNGAVICFILC
jgi:hypothetical protein